jgi:phosphatidate cytidylyltransferase
MAPAVKNLIQRTLSGLIYLVVIIGSLFAGKFTFAFVFLIISLMALYEFYGLALESGASPFIIPSMLAGAAVFVISFLVSASLVKTSMLLLTLPLLMFLFMIALYSHRPDVIRNTAVSLMGLIYIMVPLSTMNFLAFPGGAGSAFSHRIILGVLALIWINDTGAYLVGISIGRHRLFERISPKKSWEGAIGGALLTVLAAWWLNRLMGILSRDQWMIIAFITSVFGVFGDLTESLFKRSVNLKDSGSVIPGHGGVLDRIDSILFVMPLTLVYLSLSGF